MKRIFHKVDQEISNLLSIKLKISQREDFFKLFFVLFLERADARRRGPRQSTLAPDAFTTGPQRRTSPWMAAAICSGVPPMIS